MRTCVRGRGSLNCFGCHFVFSSWRNLILIFCSWLFFRSKNIFVKIFFRDFFWKFSNKIKKKIKFFTPNMIFFLREKFHFWSNILPKKYFWSKKKVMNKKSKSNFSMTKKYFSSNFFSNIKSYLSAFQRHQLELQGVSENEKFFKFKTSCPSWDVIWELIWTLIWTLIWALIWDFCPPKVGATEGRNPVLIQITSVGPIWTH